MTERLRSGVAQAPGGGLLCAVEGCEDVALVGDCLCLRHGKTRDARTAAMREIAVASGFAGRPIRSEFAVHRLNAGGFDKAEAIAAVLSLALDTLESVAGEDGREMALVRTHLELVNYYAKRAVASKPENQE